MDRSELKQRLEAAKVPESEYNLSGRGPVDNRYVLEKRGARWRIYYSERGLETQAAEFPTESEACEALLAKLVRKGAGSINRPLPLGSVVRLRTGTLKLMVVSRALRVPDASGKAYYYDYGAVAYPNGLISPDMAYFQLDAVEEVYHWGYSDEDDLRFLESIHQYLDTHPELERGKPASMVD